MPTVPPSASELLNFLDTVERDPTRRHRLSSSWNVFQDAVQADLFDPGWMSIMAERMQQLVSDGLLEAGMTSMGVTEPAVWDGGWIQMLHEWRVTAAGRQEARAFRAEVAMVAQAEGGDTGASALPAPSDWDLFLSHASEDKVAVVRPLVEALEQRGLSVWVDEIQLTLGDSLSGRINRGLTMSRFGVVVLSPDFFKKPWPLNELEGLFARETAQGAKVILPVWHNVDEVFLSETYPVLADRIGAKTAFGIEFVADEIARALTTADPAARQVAPPSETPPLELPAAIPSTAEELAAVAAAKPKYWEYLLFAGYLRRGIDAVELKWHDHALELPRGPRRVLDFDAAREAVSADSRWLSREIEALDRVFSPEVQELAFGAPGKPGDAVRIEHLAGRLTSTYEGLLDWAAGLRNTVAPGAFQEVVDAVAGMADSIIEATRAFVDRFIVSLEQAIEQLEARGSERGDPVRIELDLVLEIPDEAQARFDRALAQVERELG